MPKGVYDRTPARERFEALVDRSGGPDTCHLWTGGIRPKTGYGSFWLDGNTVDAHRVAWIWEHGPIAKGVVLRHSCRNRHCVNDRHLSTGTKGDNTRDRKRDGTNTEGERIPWHKLSVEQVREARELRALGVPFTVLGRKYGVSHQAVRQAVSGRSWKSVT
jgi:hypothetical protein